MPTPTGIVTSCEGALTPANLGASPTFGHGLDSKILLQNENFDPFRTYSRH